MTHRVFVTAAAFIALSGAASAQDIAKAATTPVVTGAPAVAATPDMLTATPLTPAPDPAPATAPAAATDIESAIINSSKDYKIGPEDLLDISVWKNPELSRTVPVRPDGKVSLPLVNDIQAAGLTPEQLRERILAEARRYIEDPSPTVVVKEINSRKVFITGQVEKPGPYPISGPTTVLHLIAIAGGLKEFADGKKILVMRTDKGRQVAYTFDYRELLKGKNLRQNIELKPGDTVVVP